MAIEFQGLNNLIERLDNIADMDKLNEALGKACTIVEREAKIKAPKVNGELRRSISSRVENGVGVVFTPLLYAPYVEYGTGLFAEGGNGRKDVPWTYRDEKTGEWVVTSGIHPQPYLRPALDENREAILQIIKEGISND